ncbi:MAG: FAD-dependent oxidoreductase [Muribaculaceae bacterium]|nr:FAD-dependent oxidoreductase [Muribaculaceae bacterium]
MKKAFFSFLALGASLMSPLTVAASNDGAMLWVEAESFADKGGWVVDQQYMDIMGSPYLMAHGIGTPVADAQTSVEIPAKGKYYVYARTYNWTSPWYDGKGPGKFRVAVNGKNVGGIVGDTGSKWGWQKVGAVNLNAGETKIALKDITGFNGRCDAVVLSTDSNLNLPDGGEELKKIRRTALGKDGVQPKVEKYDFVVVGGGIAGMCAAVTAARNGLKTALVNDRPVLGGNNSAEVRVHLGGNIELGPNKGLGRMIREFGHERKGNAKPAEFYEDDKKEAWILSEPNITLYSNCHAVGVTMEGNNIKGVTIENIENAEEFLLEAPFFSDCTGDGTIGYLAEADYRMGREARSEFNESLAPEVADSLVMGTSIQWYSEKAPNGKAKKFPEFVYGIVFNDSTCEPLKKGEWKWETGMNLNQITEAERVRDYGMAVALANWSYLKNGMKQTPDAVKDRDLAWMGFIGGKRESRRLLGDYILKQDDIDKNVSHEDASFTTSWSIDLHFPDSVNSKHFPGREYKAATIHRYIYPYAVPYRCLYSRNIGNLFMAGRNISTTHVGMGTTRVMRTTGMMGEVVGMAASLAYKRHTTPRGVYQKYLTELKEMMQAGAGKPTDGLPDNQHYNVQKHLPAPRAFTADPATRPE